MDLVTKSRIRQATQYALEPFVPKDGTLKAFYFDAQEAGIGYDTIRSLVRDDDGACPDSETIARLKAWLGIKFADAFERRLHGWRVTAERGEVDQLLHETRARVQELNDFLAEGGNVTPIRREGGK